MIPHSLPTITIEDLKNIEPVFRKNFVGKGKYTAKLESSFCNYIKKKYAVAVSNGSSALFLILNTFKKNFPNKNKVITTGYICPAVIHPIVQNGLVPVLVDINEDNLNVNINEIRNRIDNQTLTIIIPHLGGIPEDYLVLKEYDLPIIEDCAQSIGSELKGKPTGYFGDFAVFSFGSTKMVTGGQGGMILTNSEKYYKQIKSLIEYEKPADFYKKNGYQIAYNLNLTDYQAILVLSQMEQIGSFINKRRKISKFYDNFFRRFDNVKIQKETEDKRFNFYRYYTIWNYNVDNIILQLQENGIDARPSIAHNVYEYFNLDLENFKNCEKIKDKVISLPIYPNLDLGEIKNRMGKISNEICKIR